MAADYMTTAKEGLSAPTSFPRKREARPSVPERESGIPDQAGDDASAGVTFTSSCPSVT
jgi:hypothetical protein